MINLTYESLKTLNPAFNVSSCQILCKELVHGTFDYSKNEEEYIILVTTPGVFILSTKKWFGKLLTLYHISYLRLSELQLFIKDNFPYVLLAAAKLRFVFRSLAYMKIISRVVSTRSMIFNPMILPFTVKIPSEFQTQYGNEIYNYQTASLLSDRFLSISLELINITSAEIEKHCFYLNKIKKRLIIDSKVLEYTYLKAMSIAFEYGSDINEIVVRDIKITDKMIRIIEILSHIRNIEKIIWINVDFDISKDNQVCHFFQKTTTFLPNTWIFDNCNLHDGQVFTSFSNCKSSFQVFSIHRCKIINKQCFNMFCNAFAINSCFHSLNTLIITGINLKDEMTGFIGRLFTSDWLLSTQCLRTLAIKDCSINIIDIIRASKDKWIQSGIVNIDFSGNNFIGQLSHNYAHVFGSNTNFIISNCEYDAEYFVQVLSGLPKHKGEMLRLDISNAKVSSRCWNSFYTLNPPLVINSLTSLVWDGNPIDDSNVSFFIKFIASQPKLSQLSISDCAKNSTKLVIPSLVTFFKNSSHCKFTLFHFKSTKSETSFGQIAHQLIDAVLINHCLRSLDLSGQGINEVNIMKIIAQFPLTMHNFEFKGNSITTFDGLINIIDILLKEKTSIRFSWPDYDITDLLLKESDFNRINYKMKINELKYLYNSRFMSLSDVYNNSILDLIDNYDSFFQIPNEYDKENKNKIIESEDTED